MGTPEASRSNTALQFTVLLMCPSRGRKQEKSWRGLLTAEASNPRAYSTAGGQQAGRTGIFYTEQLLAHVASTLGCGPHDACLQYSGKLELRVFMRTPQLLDAGD